MPVPSTGSLVNGAALLSAFGEAITLQDGSTFMAIFKRRDDVFLDESEADQREAFRLHFPTNRQGPIDVGALLTIRGRAYYVTTINFDSDGWTAAYLSPQPAGFVPIPTPPPSGFGSGFARAFG